MGSRSLIPATLIISAIVLIGIAANYVYAQQELVVGVVKEEVGPLRVYRAYQFIDIVLYLYVNSSARLSVTEAWALLSNPTATVAVNLTTVTLQQPVDVVYANKTYSVGTLLIGRIPVSYAFTPGSSTLSIVVNGTATLGGATYFINYSKTFTVAVLDHIPVDNARLDAYRAVERVKMLYALASALGAQVPVKQSDIDGLAGALRSADTALYAGDVDTAMSTYGDVTSAASTYESQIIAALSLRTSTLDRDIKLLSTSLSSRIDYLAAVVDNINSSLSSAITSLASDVSKRFEDLSNSVSVVAQQLAAAISDSSKASSDAINSLQSQIAQLNQQISEISSGLSSLSSSQKSIADTVNMLQTTLAVASIAILVVAAVPLIRRK